MAGHSHSKNVQHRKDRVNAKKAKVFSKCAKMITVAAKLGGGDPDGNPRLRLAIDKARMASMPKDNIERAIKKGTGDTTQDNYEDILYEGYGPSGVAVLVEILTDNRNRTAPEVRKIFEKSGGNLGQSGAVAWMFERRAAVQIDSQCSLDEDALLELAMEAGADDLQKTESGFLVLCQPGDMAAVRDALKEADVPLAGGELIYSASTKSEIGDLEVARKLVRLIDSLEEHDDVQSISTNHEMTPEVLAGLAEDE